MSTTAHKSKASSFERVAIPGLHHVTAIAGYAATNLRFYTEVLGQRLVKKTVNFDDPNTYHLYYGDGGGSPGTILTFFPWNGASAGASGAGQASVISYAVPVGSLSRWVNRLRAAGTLVDQPGEALGHEVVRLLDPDGLELELVGVPGVEALPPWYASSLSGTETRHTPSREMAIRGLFGVRLGEFPGSGTGAFLTEVMGFEKVASEGDVVRFAAAGAADGVPGAFLDVVPADCAARLGVGTVHHVAFRVPDEVHQLAWKAFLESLSLRVSPVIDRSYFHSIYFREPGGVLFEIATDPPGFTADEPLADLGSDLKLPAFLEARRPAIEQLLPPLVPVGASELERSATAMMSGVAVRR